MSIYETRLRLRSSDVDMHRRLRTSVLFGLIQEAAVRHTESLGMGREKTLDRGLLWVVTMQSAEIARMPEYDEEIILRSWPGKTMHVLFPRRCSVLTASGETLIRTCSLWALVDSRTRRFVFPEKYGIEIGGIETGDEIPLPSAPKPLPCTEARDFSVPYSYVDLNGHMNNTRYFDLAEDCFSLAAEGRPLTAISAEFSHEICFGDQLQLRWGSDGQRCYLKGENERTLFRMSFSYQ